MRILIIGAGVLGSNLAHSIKKCNDVTILARNKTYENLKNNGLIIKHKLGKKSVDHFNVIDKLEENDIYDYYDFIKNSNREKDKKRISLVKNYINTKKIMDR